NGRLITPVLVKQVMSDGEVVEEYTTEVVNEQICSPTALADLQECMEAVVSHERGTGKALANLPFKVAGKTGTAQVILPKEMWGRNAYVTQDGTRQYLATFVGYFPADAPKYTCIVSIKTERKSGEVKFYTGAGVSLPVFGEIAEYIYTHDLQWATRAERVAGAGVLKAKPIARSVADVEAVDTTEGGVPNVVGMGLRDALYVLERAGHKVRFSGSGTVVGQTTNAEGEVELRIQN
ncbi:MAG: PASTA domain-containing protein, partial [Tidjanibacter sp.]|nr:PASTA domain-containing protein [Tidjanibacter sp.]